MKGAIHELVDVDVVTRRTDARVRSVAKIALGHAFRYLVVSARRRKPVTTSMYDT